MAHTFSIDDNVHHQGQGPQGRDHLVERPVYTIVKRMPIESDGRLRYRIKNQATNVERVVTEDQLSPTDS